MISSLGEQRLAAGVSVDHFAAINIHAGPGTMALLLGSGISRSAGVPTGWDVQCLLGERLASQVTPADPAGIALAAEHPDRWWAERYSRPFGYSTLLAEISPTPAARSQLLRSLLTLTAEQHEDGDMAPGLAHHRIAELVRRRLVRVIVTTNFEGLIEQAITAAGVSPQVVHHPSNVATMVPLAHADCTVIKDNGDLNDLANRNTRDELETYPGPLRTLLRQVFTEYGLIVCGWSGEWDTALVAALTDARVPPDAEPDAEPDTGEDRRRPRYPVFWSSYGTVPPLTESLIARLDARSFTPMSADQLFTDLSSRTQALEDLARREHLTRDLAVAQLRRALPNPVRHLEVRDLLEWAVGDLGRELREHASHTITAGDATGYLAELARQRQAGDTAVHLLAAGVFWDRDEQHTALWVEMLSRILRADAPTDDSSFLIRSGHREHPSYPALLAVTAAVAAAAAAGREHVTWALLTRAAWQPSGQLPVPAARAVDYRTVFDGRFQGDQVTRDLGRLPESALLERDVDSALEVVDPSASVRRRWIEAAEVRTAIASLILDRPPGRYEVKGDGPPYLDWSRGRWLAEDRLVRIPLAEPPPSGLPFRQVPVAVHQFEVAALPVWSQLSAVTNLDGMLADLVAEADQVRLSLRFGR